MTPDSKYARIEIERRFLLAAPPAPSEVVAARRIVDRYLTGTRLRLRHSQRLDNLKSEYKFTQKIPIDQPGPSQGWITTTYLTRGEYDVLATIPGELVTKTRLTVPPLGIDVFDGILRGLILAESEFGSDQDCQAFKEPSYCVAEVTADVRFTGGHLARVTRSELLGSLGDYGIAPSSIGDRRRGRQAE